MKTSLFASALLVAISLTACKPPAPAPAATVSPATAPATQAPATITGTFSGSLPCADCAGIDSTLVLTADGKYHLTDAYQDKDHSSFISEGNYSLESGGKTLHLRPSNKDEYDAYYAVLSPTQLRMLDREGKAIESKLNYTLTRK
jgi:uncharacterized lipoprotein NlpE involved in copper resistance